MVEFAKRLNYESIEKFLAAYDYEIISGETVKSVRNAVIYTPGNEPEIIKPKVQSMLNRLKEYYPDNIISGGLQRNHKNLAKNISGLYQWLGYEDAKSMLNAYGYEYNMGINTGRPSQDYQSIIDSLLEKYKDGPKPKTMPELMLENPSLKGSLKTIANKSKELFGVSFTVYLENIGVLEKKAEKLNSKSIQNPILKKEIIDAFTEKYRKIDNISEQMIQDSLMHLKNMEVRKYSNGKIYIFRGVNCKNKVVIPYGIDFISPSAFVDQNEIVEVEINAELKEIDYMTFAGCTSLSSISLPEGVISIGEKAFENCTALESIILPDSLQWIADKAFAGCKSLEKVKFKNQKTLVSEDAFEECLFECVLPKEGNNNNFKYFVDNNGNINIKGYTGSDTKVVIPNIIEGRPVTTITKGAFEGNKNIVDFTFVESVEKLEDSVFKECTELSSITIPEGVISIGEKTFENCIALKEIILPSSLQLIANKAFAGCKCLTKVEFKNKETLISNDAFEKCPFKCNLPKATNSRDFKYTLDKKGNINIKGYTGSDTKVVIPNIIESHPVTTITKGAFEGNKQIVDFTIADSVKELEESVFKECTELSSITIPEGVISIGEKTFENCINLGSIILPRSLLSIANKAFAGCRSLKNVEFRNHGTLVSDDAFEKCPFMYNLPKATDSKDFKYTIDKKGNIKIDRYIGSDTKVVIPGIIEGHLVKTIGKGAFEGNEHIVDVEMADSITKMEGYVFRDCINLKKIHISNSISEIISTTFTNCNSLEEINIPDCIEELKNNTLKNDSLKILYIGKSLMSLSPKAFPNMISGSNVSQNVIKDIIVDSDNPYLKASDLTVFSKDGKTLFSYFGDKKIYQIPEGVKRIADYAFFENRSLENVLFPDSLVSIGERAFYFTQLKSVTLGPNIKKIGARAFSACIDLTSVVIHDGIEEIGDCAFLGCDVYRLKICFVERINDRSFVEVHITDAVEHFDCIRINGRGTVFDYIKYDELFDSIMDEPDKVLVAMCRLRFDFRLGPANRKKFINYLRKNAAKAVEVIVTSGDLSELKFLEEYNVLTEKNIDSAIAYANLEKKTEILSYLMDYKNSKIGIIEDDYDL